uniref:Uncharacterized protein n=1 Tax=Chenopodium quinoa TaxID=63459 RepID=A0A803M9S2_CHEQI
MDDLHGEGIDGELHNDPGNVSDTHGGMMVANGDNNQLTLSFQGQVYVFDSVSPEKVQAVLLLLGGREVPSTVPAPPLTSANNRGVAPTPQRFNVPQRLASLLRFREKRKERNFDKKIRYTVRKEVALRMQRNKGQFTSSKPNQDESSSGATSWESNQNWGPDGPLPIQQEVWHHVNACEELIYAVGTLRDLSKSAVPGGQNLPYTRNEENGNFEAGQIMRVAGNVSDSA